MSSVIRNTRAHLALMLVSAGLGSAVHSATMDDELLVDPTVPLSIALGGQSGQGDSVTTGGSTFNLLGLLTSYELSSVLIRNEDRIAVINDERVRVGDKVGSAIVTSIESNEVTLNVDGDIQTLALYENSIKTPVQGDE